MPCFKSVLFIAEKKPSSLDRIKLAAQIVSEQGILSLLVRISVKYTDDTQIIMSIVSTQEDNADALF